MQQKLTEHKEHGTSSVIEYLMWADLFDPYSQMFALVILSPSLPPCCGAVLQEVALQDGGVLVMHLPQWGRWPSSGEHNTLDAGWHGGVSASGRTSCRKQGACCYKAKLWGYTHSTQPHIQTQLHLLFDQFTHLKVLILICLASLSRSVFPKSFLVSCFTFIFLNRGSNWFLFTFFISSSLLAPPTSCL